MTSIHLAEVQLSRLLARLRRRSVFSRFLAGFGVTIVISLIIALACSSIGRLLEYRGIGEFPALPVIFISIALALFTGCVTARDSISRAEVARRADRYVAEVSRKRDADPDKTEMLAVAETISTAAECIDGKQGKTPFARPVIMLAALRLEAIAGEDCSRLHPRCVKSRSR